MADKRIQDLPLLSQENFNPAVDYIIVQQPGGATYKMLASVFTASIQADEALAQTKSLDINYGSTGSLEFSQDFLTSANSAYVVTLTTSILENGAGVSVSGGDVSIGASRTFNFTKNSGIRQINGVNFGSSFDSNIATFSYIKTLRIVNKDKDHHVQTNYIAQLNTNVEDKLRFNFSSNIDGTQLGGYPVYFAATKVRISATIQGMIKP